MTGTRVLLVRHGQSEGNVANVWTSTHVGYPLTETGRAQARAVAGALGDRGAVAVYSSHIPRAMQTADEISSVLGLPAHTLVGLEELGVGVHEGVHDDEVAPVAQDVFGRWLRDGDLSSGFEGGETGAQIVARMTASLGHIADAHPGATVVVVSHGGAIALWGITTCPEVDAAFGVSHLLGNCDVVELVRREDGWHCERWAGQEPVRGGAST